MNPDLVNLEKDYVHYINAVMQEEEHSNIVILANPRLAGEIAKDERLSKHFKYALRENDEPYNMLFDHQITFREDVSLYEFLNCGVDNNEKKALIRRMIYNTDNEKIKEWTYGILYSLFHERFPQLTENISDYRPAGVYCLQIWFNNGMEMFFRYDPDRDEFILGRQ